MYRHVWASKSRVAAFVTLCDDGRIVASGWRESRGIRDAADFLAGGFLASVVAHRPGTVSILHGVFVTGGGTDANENYNPVGVESACLELGLRPCVFTAGEAVRRYGELVHPDWTCGGFGLKDLVVSVQRRYGLRERIPGIYWVALGQATVEVELAAREFEANGGEGASGRCGAEWCDCFEAQEQEG